MLERLTIEDWQGWADHPFTACLDDGGRQQWQLATVRPWGEAEAGYRAPYTLVFHGPREPYAPQGMRRLEHPGFGALEIFIVPTGPNRAGAMTYEAVFS